MLNEEKYDVNELGDQGIDKLFGFPRLTERIRKVVEIGTKGKLDMQNLANAVFGRELAGPNALPAALRDFGLLTPKALYEVCDQKNQQDGLVEGLLARPSVSILVGDSGLGKSPLAYQLGISVAAGVPFLGMKTQTGTVVYADLENPLKGCREVLDSVALKFLKLPDAPESFNLWTPDHSETDDFPLEKICERMRPALIVVDSLRAFDPSAEDHQYTGKFMNKMKDIATRHEAVVLFIHHVRKPQGEGPTPRLADDQTRLLEWLNSASGSRAVVNQSDTRIAVDDPQNRGDAALVVRWHRRFLGERGPVFLARVGDEDGEPIGYRSIHGIQLLSDANQRDAFLRLPRAFRFQEAVAIYGRQDNATSQWLKKCESLGLVAKLGGRRGYVRIDADGQN